MNTEIPVWAIDEIATPEALGAWLGARDLVADGTVIDGDAFVRARALRDLLRELARRNTHGEPADRKLRAEFAAVLERTRLRFDLGADGAVRVEPVTGDVNGALGTIVARVVESQAAGTWRRLKSCPGSHCGWLFYDGSRNGSSRWCSMSICGNRQKTAAYRRRRATS